MKQALINFVQDNFFNTFLKIQYSGFFNALDGVQGVQRYANIFNNIRQFPRLLAEAQPQLLLIEHPQPLRTEEQVLDCMEQVRRLGLFPHKSREKNWDFFSAFSHVLQRGQSDDVVLDLGSGSSSVILNWLHLYGYQNLYGCDLVSSAHQQGHIQYSKQDIEQTTYSDNFADVITCLSVIEHQVNIERLFKECKRLLKPNGIVLVSTDYWCDEKDLTGVEDEFGQVKIFNQQMLQTEILDVAEQVGFRFAEPQWNCVESVVGRPTVPAIDKQYTFYFFQLEIA